MQKEVHDILNVCEQLIAKSNTIEEISKAIKEIIKEIQAKTSQVDIPQKSLALRKPLANLFILNSNMDDCIKSFEKSYDDLKKI
ncbi:MAG: hypothetical protein M1475_08805 [Actinobacteria bacterium]|nr:hypothetical protein [Actinomycetota bacterium]MCL6088498.1 hypothetical protein [Actinomycetota bacterium]